MLENNLERSTVSGLVAAVKETAQSFLNPKDPARVRHVVHERGMQMTLNGRLLATLTEGECHHA